MAGYQLIKPQEGIEGVPRRLVLDTNVAIDIEDYYYGRARVERLLPALQSFLIEHAGEDPTHSSAPDINYALAILESCSTRTSGIDLLRERRLRRALQVVLAWTRAEVTKNFSNRHAPANRDKLLRKGLPMPEVDGATDRPGAMLVARYGALLFLCHLERSRKSGDDSLARLKKFVDWMSFELGVRGVYETQLALDLFLGDKVRMNGARRLLKLGGREEPNTLADRAWNAAWDLEFLSMTERWSFGLTGSIVRDQRLTFLVTRNLDPGFIRMRSEITGVSQSTAGRFPLVSLGINERLVGSQSEVRTILEAGLSPTDSAERLAVDPRDVAARALEAIADVERLMGASPAALKHLV